jgi:hypothetical protein
MSDIFMKRNFIWIRATGVAPYFKALSLMTTLLAVWIGLCAI